MEDKGFRSGLSFGSSVSTLSCKYSTVLVSEPISGHAFDVSPFPIYLMSVHVPGGIKKKKEGFRGTCVMEYYNGQGL